MAMNALGRLEVVFTFNDQSRKGTSSAENNVKKLSTTAQTEGKKMQNAFTGAFPAILTLGLMRQMASGIVALTRPSRDLQTSLRQMAAFSGQTEEQFASFTEATLPLVKRLGLITAKSTPELIQAMTELQKKGISDTGDAFRALVPAAALAQVAQIKVADSAEAASALYTVWGERGQGLTRRLNQMAVAAKGSRLNFSELTDMVTRTGSAVAIAEPQFADLVFLLAKTRDIAPSAAIAFTQVRRAYEVFSAKQEEVAAVLGVSSTAVDGNGEHLRDLSEMIVQVAAEGGDLNQKMRELNKTFGTRAFTPLAAIGLALRKSMKESGEATEEWRKNFFKLRDEVNNADDVIFDLFTTMTKDNPEIAIARLGVAFEQLGEAGGGALIKGMVQSINGLTNAVTGITAFVDAISSVSTAVTSTIPGLSSLIGWVGRLMTTFTVAVAGMAAMRAGFALLATVVNYAKAPLISTKSVVDASSTSMVRNAATTNAAAAASTRFAAIQRAVAVGASSSSIAIRGLSASAVGLGAAVTGVGRAALFLRTALGPVGLIVSAISLIVASMGSFDDNISDLNKAVMAGQDSAQADMIRRASEQFSDKIGAAAERWEKMFKETPAVLRTSTFNKLDNAVENLLGGMDPSQAAKIGEGLRSTVRGLQGRFADIKQRTAAGEEIDAKTVLDFNNQLGVVATALQQHGLIQGNKEAAKLAKELIESQKAMLTFNKATEDRTKIMDRLTQASGQGETFQRTSVSEVKKREEEEAQRVARRANLEEKLQTMAQVRASAPTDMFDRFLQAVGFSPDVEAARSQILQENPNLVKQMKSLELEARKQTAALNKGITVKVEPGSGLDNVVSESAEDGAERGLVPGVGR